MSIDAFRSSSKVRLGIAAPGLMIVVYLTVISLAYIDQLDSTKRIVIFSFLWLIGLVALRLLVRAWCHFGNRVDEQV